MRTDLQGTRHSPWWQIVLVGRNPKWTIARIALMVALCFATYNYVLRPIRVQGISMLPTYKERGINCINLLAYRFRAPQRGDVVVIQLQAGAHVMLMKRIVGLPGEMVGFHEGHVVVNGEMLEERYLQRDSDWERPPEKVLANEYFVVGDNRSMPQSEHEFGHVPRALILGKVVL
jgi:signal peptidase I